MLPLWILFVGLSVAECRLMVKDGTFYFGTTKVFLSGPNIAWSSYGYDFGNGQYAVQKTQLESWLTSVQAAGGNTVRIWVHVEGANTPKYDSSGYVTAPDNTGTLISDMLSYLNAAKARNIMVVFVLWNGALMRQQNTINLLWDDAKLNAYITKALKPMVTGLKNHPALAAWEIMNEPEGSVYAGKSDANSCFDTSVLAGSGAGWTNLHIPMKNILKFVNLQAGAIKDVDPGALVTVGSWSEKAQNSAFTDSKNYYTNACLIAAGAKTNGVLDFYQIHTYSWNGKWNTNAPFNAKTAASYKLDKPLVIGEFAKVCAQGETIQALFTYAYTKGYSGAWSWAYDYTAGSSCSDDRPTQDQGMLALKGKTQYGTVNFIVA